MEQNISKSGNLISDVTKGEVTKVEYGGDIPQVGFSLSEWERCYLINGSYKTRNADGTPRTHEDSELTRKMKK